jgi:HEAT repeat protein
VRSRSILAVAIVATLLCVGLWLQRHALHRSPPPPVSSPAAPSPPASVDARSAGRLWRVGHARTYELRSDRRITFTAQPSADRASPSPVSQAEDRDQFRLAIAANLQLAVVQADALSVLIEALLIDPRVEVGALDRAATGRLLGLLQQPLYLQLSPTGQLRGMRLPSGHSPFSRGLLKALFGNLQYVSSDRAGAGGKSAPGATASQTWTSREFDATGEYEARYELSTDRRTCRKTRLRYTQVSTAQGLLPVASLGQLRGGLQVQLELDPNADAAAEVIGLRGEEDLQIDPGPGMPQVASAGSFSLRFLQSQPLPDASARASRALGSDYEIVAMGQAELDPDSERRSDQGLVRGASFAELLSRLAGLSATADGAERAELLSRVAALVRLEPATAAQAQAAIVAGASGATTRTLLGALGAAASEPAQSALVGLAGNAALSVDVRSNAVAMLGLGEHPSDATVAALGKLSGDGNADVRGTAALALGNAALAQRRAGQVGESEQAADELLAKLAAATTVDEQILYLQALGNAGDARALPAIQSALASPDEELRSAAVTALRFIAAEPVDALIASTLLRDPSVRVRRSAVFAAGFRTLIAILPALRGAALGDAEQTVRAEIVPVLGRSLQVPGVLEILQAMASRDPAPEVRRAAAVVLTPR